MDRKSIERREFLRKAAATGAMAAWAAPIVNTVAATPAFAFTNGTPAACYHSLGGHTGSGCMGACQGSGKGCGATCNQQCSGFCPNPGQGGGEENRLCKCDDVCEPSNWANCTYTGPTCE